MATLIAILIILLVICIFGIPIILAIWLWYFHDRHLKILRDEIFDTPSKINEHFRGRGATAARIQPHLNAALRPLEVELKKRESARQLFLDRAHFISLFKIR